MKEFYKIIKLLNIKDWINDLIFFSILIRGRSAAQCNDFNFDKLFFLKNLYNLFFWKTSETDI